MRAMIDRGPTSDAPDWNTLGVTLRCPRCGYDLRMLPQPRCPECGLQFEWAELVTAAQDSLAGPFFEYQWRRRPVSSFLGTIGRAMFPWWLWRRTRLTAEPRVVPLLAVVILTVLLHAICYVSSRLLLLGVWGYWSGLYSPRGWAGALRALRGNVTAWAAETTVLLAGGLAVWLSLQVFRQTMSRHRVRQRQILRMVVWAWAGMVAWRSLVLLLYAIAGVGLDRFVRLPYWFWSLDRRLSTIAETTSLLCFIASLLLGLTTYLKLRRGWIDGLMSLLLALVLLTAVSVVASLYWYESWANSWTRALDATWPHVSAWVECLLAWAHWPLAHVRLR
jgi:hypothetical protein